MRVIWKRPSVTAGMTRACRPLAVSSPVVEPPRSTVSPRPKLGMTPSVTENTKISRMPIRKVGSEIPASDTAMNTFESQLSR